MVVCLKEVYFHMAYLELWLSWFIQMHVLDILGDFLMSRWDKNVYKKSPATTSLTDLEIIYTIISCVGISRCSLVIAYSEDYVGLYIFLGLLECERTL